MRFIFAIDKLDCMISYLWNIFIIEDIYLQVFSECVIQNIHHYTCVIHHIQSIDGWSNVAFVPPILNYIDMIHSSRYDADKCSMIFHNFIDNLEVSLLGLLISLSIELI